MASLLLWGRPLIPEKGRPAALKLTNLYREAIMSTCGYFVNSGMSPLLFGGRAFLEKVAQPIVPFHSLALSLSHSLTLSLSHSLTLSLFLKPSSDSGPGR